MVFLIAGFPEKPLRNGSTSWPELLNLRLSLKALYVEPFCRESSGETAEPRVHREGTDPLFNKKMMARSAAARAGSA